MTVFSKDAGALNNILIDLGIIKEPIHYFGKPKLFWPLMIIFEDWKDTGFSNKIKG